MNELAVPDYAKTPRGALGKDKGVCKIKIRPKAPNKEIINGFAIIEFIIVTVII